jgi:hypothetical protein
MNSTIKTAAKMTEELSQSNENSNTKATLVDSLNKKWKNKVKHGQHIRSTDR